MWETKVLLTAIAAVALSVSTDVSLAQFTGPPVIIQTPQPLQQTPQLKTDNLKPLTGVTLPAPPAAPSAARPAAAAPAAAVPRPCVANTKC